MNLTHVNVIPLAVFGVAWAVSYAVTKRLAKRPRPASLRAAIVRNARMWLALAGVQVAYIALWTSLYAAGLMPRTSMIIGTAVSGAYLAVDVYMLSVAGRAWRTYKSDPIAAYIAEIRHAFGPLQ